MHDDREIRVLAAHLGITAHQLHLLQRLQEAYHRALAAIPEAEWAASIPIQLSIEALLLRGEDPQDLLQLTQFWVDKNND